MKIPAASLQYTRHAVGRLFGFGILLVALLAETGCVSQRAYQQARAEAEELTRSRDAAREEVKELDRYIATLQAANREEDNAATELRAAIQREEDTLPALRKRANDKLASLHAQVAGLVSQSRLLARQIADAKQERASLKVLVAQYKQEVEEARMLPEPSVSPSMASPPTPAEPAGDPIPAIVTAPNPVTPPQQMAQVTPVTPVKPPATPHPVQTPTQAVEESWLDMIMNWFFTAWNWILGLFS